MHSASIVLIGGLANYIGASSGTIGEVREMTLMPENSSGTIEGLARPRYSVLENPVLRESRFHTPSANVRRGFDTRRSCGEGGNRRVREVRPERVLERRGGHTDLAAERVIELCDQARDDDDRRCESGDQKKAHSRAAHPQERREADR